VVCACGVRVRVVVSGEGAASDWPAMQSQHTQTHVHFVPQAAHAACCYEDGCCGSHQACQQHQAAGCAAAGGLQLLRVALCRAVTRRGWCLLVVGGVRRREMPSAAAAAGWVLLCRCCCCCRWHCELPVSMTRAGTSRPRREDTLAAGPAGAPRACSGELLLWHHHHQQHGGGCGAGGVWAHRLRAPKQPHAAASVRLRVCELHM
jgi:hypothetical protein